MLTPEEKKSIIDLIHRQVVPAIGCTEPIAVALCVAKAKEILSKHTTEAHLFTHAAAVSAAMGAMAEHFGEDKEHWEAIGYLHDGRHTMTLESEIRDEAGKLFAKAHGTFYVLGRFVDDAAE